MAVEECRKDTAKEEMACEQGSQRAHVCAWLQTDSLARVKVTGTHGCPWQAEPLAFKIFDCCFLEGR